MRRSLFPFLFCGISFASISCAEDDSMCDVPIIYIDNNQDDSVHTELESSEDSTTNAELKAFVDASLYANNSKGNQSSASYGDYLILVPKSRGYLHLYNLRTKSLLYSLKLTANTEKDYKGVDLCHCNQTTFGVDFYEPNDPLPLLYISQRAREDRRCILEVYRLLPTRTDGEDDFSSMEAKLVQTILFPAMTVDNSLGNVNCAIDTEKRLMYTYSRNNVKTDANYRECKVSCFDIPDCRKDVVYLEDDDIKSSFMLGCSALNMQGGCVKDGKLYIGQGYKSAGYIYLNVVDLKNEKLLERIDMLAKGVEWEPEGCFIYNGNIMMSTGSNIWQLNFE